MGRGKRHVDRTVSRPGQAAACAGRRSAESGRRDRAPRAPSPISPKAVLAVAAVLAAVVVFIYAPACHYGFLSYDDPAYVSQNAQVIRGLTLEGVRWAFTTGHASNWHPVTWMSHMLDVTLFGMNAGRHHCVNLLLHIANAILLFGLLYRTTGARGPSAAVAALFAAHPLHVESVVWIAERKPDPGRYLTVAAVFALGLMSKPMLVTLPPVLLLLDLWPLNRVRFESGSSRVWLGLLREKAPLFLMSAASSVATILAQWRGGAVQDFELLPMHQRAANALVSYAAYLGRMLWPAHLAPYYPYQPLPTGIVLGCALILAAVSAVVIRFSRNRPFLFMGWFWYVITLVPVIGLIQVGGQARADRYTYIPLIGIFIIAAWGIPLVFEGLQGGRTMPTAAACILVCVLAAGARSQVRCWESDLSLWRHAVEKTGDNYFARTNLGFALMGGGDLDAAVAQFNEALRIRPESAETHNGLGTALLKLGQPDAALERFTTALRIRPGFAEAHSNRGMALAQRGDIGEAFAEFQRALQISPESPEIQYNFGFALANLGKPDEAMLHFRKALTLKPDYADAHFQMGNVYAGMEMWSEAEAEYTEAIRIRPKYADAHNNLGVILLRQNRRDDAVAHFTEALRIDPGNRRAQENLNRALAQ
mgnify:CR=1 FL=1